MPQIRGLSTLDLLCVYYDVESGSCRHEGGSEMARRTRPRILGLSALDLNVCFVVCV